MADDPFEFNETGVRGEVTYDTFGCNVFDGSPPTPDKVTPNVLIRREVHNGHRMTMPDGRRVDFWAFNDPLSPNARDRDDPFPAPLMRVREGQIVHTHLKVKVNDHTIHHHGQEPTTFNDGVGHVSFEVKSEYTYQWKPTQAGTFFYHCHKNTVLHFELGMYGLLIVDPPGGPGRLYRNGPTYDTEAFWIADDVDPRWHDMASDIGHDAGMCGEDVGLNIFEPKYFLISGAPAPTTLTDPRCMVRTTYGKRILIRLLNASYSVLRVTLPLTASCVSWDGRPLGRNGSPWSAPYDFQAGTTFELGTAQRCDLIIEPPPRGTYRAKLEFLHWITGEVQDNGRGVAETQIIVT